ncbi:MAG: thiamine diphosphokinase, partial [Bacilli bacterium]
MKKKRLIIVGPLDLNITIDKDSDYIGLDYGSVILLNKGLSHFKAIGDFDSTNETDYLRLKQSNIEMIKLAPQKNESDFEAALQTIKPNQYQEIIGYGL